MKNVKKCKFKKILKKYWFAYVLAFLVLGYYLLFCYAPMYGILAAFQDFKVLKGIFGSKWVGLKNFANVFANSENREVYVALKNTIIISLLRLCICFWVPMILAILLNEIKNAKIRTAYQTFIYLPHFISWAVIGGLVTLFLQTTGLFNRIIEFFGGESKYFLMEESTFLPTILLTDIWKNSGWGTIIYLAAIGTINPELYEAAQIDGANRFKQIIHIMLPGIMPTISLMLILAVSGILSAGFDQVIVFQNFYNRDVSTILDTYVYDLGIKGAYKAEATAVGLCKSVVSTILLIIADKVSKKMGQRGII